MKLSIIIAALALLCGSVQASPDGGKHSLHIGDSETKLINELGPPQRTIAVEDGAGKVVGKHLYYVVETGAVRFYVEDGHIVEITNERERR